MSTQEETKKEEETKVEESKGEETKEDTGAAASEEAAPEEHEVTAHFEPVVRRRGKRDGRPTVMIWFCMDYLEHFSFPLPRRRFVLLSLFYRFIWKNKKPSLEKKMR
jgi:hypothetical protein